MTRKTWRAAQPLILFFRTDPTALYAFTDPTPNAAIRIQNDRLCRSPDETEVARRRMHQTNPSGRSSTIADEEASAELWWKQ